MNRIRVIEQTPEVEHWPSLAEGIVLLATRVADEFFSTPSSRGLNASLDVVEITPEGQIELVTLSTPDSDIDSARWQGLFAKMIAEPRVIACCQTFETDPDSPVLPGRDGGEALVQSLYAQGRGVIQVRVTPFMRFEEECVPVPVMATSVLDPEDLVLVRGAGHSDTE